DRLDIAAGRQSEARAAVVEQVELDIAAAPDELMAALLGRPGKPHARPHDRREDSEKGLADGADKGEVALPVAAVEVIEKDAAGPKARVVRRTRDVVAEFGRELALDGRDVDPDLLEDMPAHERDRSAAAAFTLPVGAFETARRRRRGMLPGEFVFDRLEGRAD